METEKHETKPLSAVQPQWGETAGDHFGYASDEERRAKRGLEDWELVNTIPESQKNVPYWFVAIIVTVLLVAIGLSFPFWGQRPGHHVAWFNWGFILALFYIAAASALVYFMTQLYGSTSGGRLDSDKSKDKKDE
ncbi:MAG TPA: hypothetical protein VKC56_08070 [Gallionellaceae bacterium]|nr:hypothetical protein [Gallionellaceae bacterium]